MPLTYCTHVHAVQRCCDDKSFIGRPVAVLDTSPQGTACLVAASKRTFQLWWYAVWSDTHHFEQGGGSFVYMYMTLLGRVASTSCALFLNHWNSLIPSTHPAFVRHLSWSISLTGDWCIKSTINPSGGKVGYTNVPTHGEISSDCIEVQWEVTRPDQK